MTTQIKQGIEPDDGYLDRPLPGGSAAMVDVILDKGLMIDAYVRASVLGVELITVEAQILIASVDTYLRFAAAIRQLELGPRAADHIAGY